MTLDSLELVRDSDLDLVYRSVAALPEQCSHGWEIGNQTALPGSYKKAANIIVAGMGGSHLGARLLQSVYAPTFKKPIQVVNSYLLPAYAGKDTLVIASSYSGNTEESLMVAQQAHKKGCKVLVLATGGKLVEWAQHYELPVFQFDPIYNPSKQPRLAVGYSLFLQLAILKQLGLKVSEKELKQIVSHLHALSEDWDASQTTFINRPKQIAKQLHGFVPMWMASEHLAGNIHIASNQTNETAKSFSSYYELPELNHHLMEGLKHPGKIYKKLRAMAIVSDKYLPRNQKRFAITKQVMERQLMEWVEYRPTAETTFGEACEVLMMTGYVTFYLSVLYKENPQAVQWVDYFKRELDQA
jgi:glucose/mannose-6-phosphate isomerase